MAGLLNGEEKWKANRDNQDNLNDIPGLRKIMGSAPGTTPDAIMGAFKQRRELNKQTNEGKPIGDEPQEWRDYVDSHYHDWEEQTPPEVKQAVNAYQQELYTAINGQLRDGRIDPKELKSVADANGQTPEQAQASINEITQNMDKAFDTVPPLDRPATLHRVLGASDAAHHAGGKAFLEKLQKGLIKPGGTLSDKGFQSTSYVPLSIASGKPGVIFKINAPVGTRAVPLMAVGGADIEREVVLPRDSQYRIKSINPVGNSYHVELDYLPNEAQNHSAEVFSAFDPIHRSERRIEQPPRLFTRRSDATGSDVATFSDSHIPGTHPPRPGLVYDRDDHHWHRPDTGEKHPHIPSGHVPAIERHERLTDGNIDAIHDVAGRIAHELAPDVHSAGPFAKVKDAAITGIARGYLFLLKHHDTLDKIGSALGAVIDLPSDLRKFGYEPTTAGTGSGTTSDPIRQHLGIGTHLATTLASKTIVAAWGLAKKLAGKKTFAEGDKGKPWLDNATELIAGLMGEVNAAYGLTGGIDKGRIQTVLSGEATFADHSGLIQKEIEVHQADGTIIKQKRWVRPDESPTTEPTTPTTPTPTTPTGPTADEKGPVSEEKGAATGEKTADGLPTKPPTDPSALVEKFKKSAKGKNLVDADVQRWCEEGNEAMLASHVGGKNLPDCEPMDVQIPPPPDPTKHGIESKTMVFNSHGQIHMNADAKQRKRAWRRKNKVPVHTVVTDDREVYNAFGPGNHDLSKRKVYYRRGFGSFKVEGMYEVPGGYAGLKELIDMPTRKLPPGAWKAKKKEKISKLEDSTAPGAGTAATQTPIEVKPEHRELAAKWVVASDVPEHLRERYTQDMAQSLSSMTEGCRKAALETLSFGSVKFHPDLKSVVSAASKITKKNELGTVGFVHDDGGGRLHLHVDGPSDESNSQNTALGIYTHELGHCVDADDQYSNDPKWKSAWKREIFNGRSLLSKYARKNEAEGFAELHRHICQKGIEATRAKWPACVKFLESRKLL